MHSARIFTYQKYPVTFEEFQKSNYTDLEYNVYQRTHTLFAGSDTPRSLVEILKACPQLEHLWIGCYDLDLRNNADFTFAMLPKLKSLRLMIEGPFNLPTDWQNATQLEKLVLKVGPHTGGLAEVADQLHLLTKLTYMQPPKTTDFQWFSRLSELPALHSLDLSSYTTMPFAVPEMIKLLRTFPQLKKVFNFYPKKNEALTDALLGLDFLETVELISTVFKDPTSLPLFFCRFKNVKFFSYRSTGYKECNTFREQYAAQPLPDAQRELLFLCWIKSWNRVKERTVNHLLERHKAGIPTVLAGYDKLSSLTKTALKAKLKATRVSLDEKTEGETVHLLHSKSPWEFVEKVVLEKKPFVVEEQLTEFLHFLETPYLLESENKELSQSIVRLLASEEADNLMLAFEMIQNGGATREVQSMVAAIALAHYETTIRKKAKQVYIKVGSAAFVPLMSKTSYKRTDFELRLSKHENISRTDFLLMVHFLDYVRYKRYHDTTRFTLSWSRLDIQTLSENILLFPGLQAMRLSQNTELDMQQVLPLLAQIPSLEMLYLNGCKTTVPESIIQVQSLTTLDLSGNRMDDFSVLSQLPHLEQLTVKGCKIKNWDWLQQCPALQWLCVSTADQAKVPHIGTKKQYGDTLLQLK